MAATNGTVAETLVGAVEATNDKGIKVQGRWFNFSQYHDVPHPERGQQVALEAKGNFIQKLTIRAAAEPTGAEPTPTPSPAQPPSTDTRELRIIRQAMAKAAASFMALRTDATVGDVIGMAELLERWVTRE
jgi:hypothetical protein